MGSLFDKDKKYNKNTMPTLTDMVNEITGIEKVLTYDKNGKAKIIQRNIPDNNKSKLENNLTNILLKQLNKIDNLNDQNEQYNLKQVIKQNSDIINENFANMAKNQEQHFANYGIQDSTSATKARDLLLKKKIFAQKDLLNKGNILIANNKEKEFQKAIGLYKLLHDSMLGSLNSKLSGFKDDYYLQSNLLNTANNYMKHNNKNNNFLYDTINLKNMF